MDKGYVIVVICATIFVLCVVGTASAANWSVDGSGGADFTGIQEAINNASAGDTILVHSGVYYENVVVNKSVTLKGIGQPVVDASGKGDAITLIADGITVVGFTAKNCLWWGAGIKIISSNNTITGNNVSNNNCGIGFYDSYSNNHLYLNNLVNNTDNVNIVNVYSRRSANIWNSTEKITYFYLGTTYESYLGNYRDDYDGTDTDGDGIGDTPYSIDPKNEESDPYPLMKPFENYIT